MNRTTASKRSSGPTAEWFWRRGLVVAVLAGLIVAAFLMLDLREILRVALDRIERLGHWGPILFVSLYIIAAVLFVPGSALTLGAGAAFGLPWAAVYASIASTLGATAAFLVGRHVARGWVAAKMEGNTTFAAMDQGVEREGWKLVLLTRLSPVFPFNLLNYAFGLTRVKLRHYVLASWIGMMPGTILYVYLGSLARAGADPGTRTSAEWALYAFGLVATLVATLVITRIARNALARRGGPVLAKS